MPDIFIEEKHKMPKSRNIMFPAGFALHPGGVHFDTQGENEEIHLFLRRHFITNVPWILFAIFLLIAPIIVLPVMETIFPFTTLFTSQLSFILLAFYYVVVFGMAILVSFINWYFNVYIVTDQRVVDVDFVNVIYREVASTRLNLIQDVTVKTSGVIRAFFDYGDVFIQTAGTEANFDFHAVPHPQQVAHEIEIIMQKARNREGVSNLEKQLKE